MTKKKDWAVGSFASGSLGLALVWDSLSGWISLPRPWVAYVWIALVPIWIVTTAMAIRRDRLSAVPGVFFGSLFLLSAALFAALAWSCSKGGCL